MQYVQTATRSFLVLLIMQVALFSAAFGQLDSAGYEPLWFDLTGENGRTSAITFNRDFSRMAAGTSSGWVYIYDLQTEEPVVKFRAHSMSIRAMDFSPDGKMVATISWDALLRAWDTETGKRRRNHALYEDRYTDIAHSPDGQFLAAGLDEGRILIYPIRSHLPKTTISGLPSEVSKMTYSPDGLTIAAALKDGSIYGINLETEQRTRLDKGGAPSPGLLAFTDDSQYLITAPSSQVLRILDTKAGERIAELSSHYNLAAGVFSDNAGQILAASEENNYAFFWNPYWRHTVGFEEVLQSNPTLQRALKPRDQFETLSEAFYRQHEGYSAYSSKFIQGIIQAERERMAAIQSSIKPVLIPPSQLVFHTYDIEKEVFPVSINGAQYDLKINRDDARSLFENREVLLIEGIERLSDSLTYKTYANIAIVHPITSERFEVGPQYDLEEFQTIASLPAGLTVDEATFTDSDGDGVLSAGELAVVQFTVGNTGPGPAQLVRIVGETQAHISGLSAALGTIDPEDQRAISLTIKGEDDLTTGDAEIVFAIKEINGFNGPPVVLKIPTQAFQMPNLGVDEVGVEDPQGRSIISPGMIVNITMRVKNDGPGSADQIRARVTAGKGVFIAGSPNPSQTVIDVGMLTPGNFKDVSFQAFANNESEGFPLEVLISESTGRFVGQPSDLGLTLFKPQRSAQEMVVTARALDNKSAKKGTVLMADISRNIPQADTVNTDAIAVIVGNRTYQQGTPPVAYALNDAQLVRKYVEQSLGYRPGNILYLEDATLTNLKVVFGDRNLPNGRLKDLVKPGRSDVFVFYSGHGAPDPNSNKGYIMPVDGDPSRLELTGYGLDVLYENLSATQARSITVVIDACFSGATGGGDMLIAAASPIGIRINDPSAKLGNQAAVITASTGQQVASWYPEMRHGLLTYYFLKGLQGGADKNTDNAVTLAEMQTWLSDESDGLPYMARRLHSREQSPMIWGNQNFVLR